MIRSGLKASAYEAQQTRNLRANLTASGDPRSRAKPTRSQRPTRAQQHVTPTVVIVSWGRHPPGLPVCGQGLLILLHVHTESVELLPEERREEPFAGVRGAAPPPWIWWWGSPRM